MGAAVAFYAFIGLFVLAWFTLVVVNAYRLVRVVAYEGDDRAENRGWVAWTVSVVGLFTGCFVAAPALALIEWVLQSPEPFEDSVGTMELMSQARTNVWFTIASNLVVGAVTAVFLNMSGALPLP